MLSKQKRCLPDPPSLPPQNTTIETFFRHPVFSLLDYLGIRYISRGVSVEGVEGVDLFRSYSTTVSCDYIEQKLDLKGGPGEGFAWRCFTVEYNLTFGISV